MRKKITVFIILLSGIIARFTIDSLDIIRRNDPGDFSVIKYDLFSASSHAPIHIDGNAALITFFNGSGADGTFLNPFIIEDYNIIAEFYGALINISNTDLYLIIKNLTIGMADQPLWIEFGIYISNCTNVEIKQSDFYGVYDGIRLSNSSNIIIFENILRSTVTGIKFKNSNNNYIFNNSFINNIHNINLENSNNNTISGNIAWNSPFGIKLYNSNNNTLQDNIVWNDIGFHYNLNCCVDKVIVSSDNPKAYLLYLENSHNNTLLRNILRNNRLGNGIHLLNSNNNILMENNATNNHCSGISLISSDENRILKNNATDNGHYGVYIDLSENNSIEENILHSNGKSCILKGSMNNYFSENVCANISFLNLGSVFLSILGFGMIGCIIVISLMFKRGKEN